MPVIHLRRSFADEMIAHAHEGKPNEVCGVLAGKEGQITRLYRAVNAAERPLVTYEIEPHDQLRIFNAIDDAGLEIIGIYHSHPSSPAFPSPTDRRLAFYPDAVYFIVSLTDARHPSLRGFRIVDDEVTEIEIILDEGE